MVNISKANKLLQMNWAWENRHISLCGALSYPEGLQKWWPGTRQRSRWRWRQRGPEGSQRLCSRWCSDGNGASGPSPSHRKDSLYGPEGPPAAPLECPQLDEQTNKTDIDTDYTLLLLRWGCIKTLVSLVQAIFVSLFCFPIKPSWFL